MGRVIVGVIVAYALMAVLIFALFTGAYLVLGPDRSFKPESYEPSVLWLAVSFALGLGAAIAAGFVAATIAPGTRVGPALAIVVIVLGLLMAIPNLTATPSTEARTSTVGNMEAMMKTRQPAWVAVLNPFVGAAGVMIGARLRGRPKAS